MDLSTGLPRHVLGDQPTQHAVFADQGRRVVVLGRDGRLSGWDPQGTAPLWQGEREYDYLFAGDEPMAMAFARLDSVVLVDSRDGAIRKLSDGVGLYYGGLSRNGRWAALSFRNGEVILYDTRSGNPVQRIQPYSGMNPRVAVSDDGLLVAAGGADSVIRLWDRSRAAVVALLRGHQQRMQDLAFSPDGQLLVSVAWGAEVRSWDLSDLRSPGALLLQRAEERSKLHLEGIRVVSGDTIERVSRE